MIAMEVLFYIIIGVVFVNNFVLSKFLGLCPFIGVTKKTSSAFGMGMAVTFVMTMASVVTWVIYNFALKPGESNIFSGLIGTETTLVPILKTVSYILVIASFVQLVELFLRKVVPALYQALGIYLPLITTNCAILGVALLNTTDAPRYYNLFETLAQGFGAGIGFTIAMLLMSGIRERLELLNLPKSFEGVPIAFVCTGFMALAFSGFAGLV